MVLPRLSILKIDLTMASREEILREILSWLKIGSWHHYIVTPNPEITLQAIKNDDLKKALKSADIAIADGVGLRFASLIFGVNVPPRIAGADLMRDIVSLAHKYGYSVGLLGGEEGIAEKAKLKLTSMYPGLKVVYADEGVKKSEFVLNGGRCVEEINKASPDILFVAFGAPKQELWLYNNLSKLHSVKVGMAVGGTLDFIAEKFLRAPYFLRHLGLEWFFRLCQDPVHRAKRIFKAVFVFPLVVLWWKLRIWTTYRKNVVALILNKNKKVLLVAAQRYDDIRWQFPQGGMEGWENPEETVFREMKEELGTDKFKILKHIPLYHSYVWPSDSQIIRGYKGQVQDLFIMEFLGGNNDFDLEKDGELKDFCWVDADKVLEMVEPCRRDGIDIALKILSAFA